MPYTNIHSIQVVSENNNYGRQSLTYKIFSILIWTRASSFGWLSQLLLTKRQLPHYSQVRRRFCPWRLLCREMLTLLEGNWLINNPGILKLLSTYTVLSDGYAKMPDWLLNMCFLLVLNICSMVQTRNCLLSSFLLGAVEAGLKYRDAGGCQTVLKVRQLHGMTVHKFRYDSVTGYLIWEAGHG